MPDRRLRTRRATRTSAAIAGLLVLLLLAPGGLAVAVSLNPSPEKGPVRGRIATSRMYASDGSELARLHGEIDRDPVAFDAIPEHLRNAVVAIEDRRFWSHRGIDPRGIVRALVRGVRSNNRLQGASTISQQLVKNIYFPGQSRTVWRKIQEVVLTLGLESMSAKRKILEAYLNTLYFGRGVYGVQAAARSYFRKDVSKLTLSESAFLAGLIHMPAHYDWNLGEAPGDQMKRKRAAVTRRNIVLDAMWELGYITAAESRSAGDEKLVVKPPLARNKWKHAYFVDAVLREIGALGGGTRPLDRRFDSLGKTATERAQAVYGDGLRIYTTLDPRIQKEAERALAEQLPPGQLPKLSAAVASVQPHTGRVRALIGGRDYYPAGCENVAEDQLPPSCRHAKVNLALGPLAGGSGRQPGSSFKPFVLAAALEDGISLKQQIESSPFTYKYRGGEWKVRNYEGGGGGVIPITEAMVRSVNAAYARIEIQLLGEGNGITGAGKVARVARKMGIDFPTASVLKKRCGDKYLTHGGCTPADLAPSVALGAKEVSPLQMAAAFATFAAQGIYAKPTTITKIEDANGKVLYRNRPETRRAISSATAIGVSHVLQQVVQRGTGRRAALARPAAGKTGTSQAWRDAWFNGYVPQLASVVWVGNPIPVQTYSGTWVVESMTPSNGYGIRIVGGSYPALIWHSYMEPAVAPLEVATFPDPPKKLFGEPKKVPGSTEGIRLGESGVSASIALSRAGMNVTIIRQCPPGGNGSGRGLRVWKTERNGDQVTLYVSRAVCR